MKWSILPTISAPMPLQMALDELLFESRKKEPLDPVLRFYISSEPWISIGYSFQTPATRSRSGLILSNPRLPVCRRVTGGGCVLHGRDLIFSLIARYEGTGTPENRGSQSPFSSVRTSYAKIHEGVKRALRDLGFDPEFYGSGKPLPKGSDCFDFPVESDLSWKGRKISGGAQKRSEGVLLHHESILVPPGLKREDLVRAVRKGLEQVFDVAIEDTDLDPGIYFQAERKAMSHEA